MTAIALVSVITHNHIKGEYLFRERQYLTHCYRDIGANTLPECISPKLNIIKRMAFELAYCNVAVQDVNHVNKIQQWLVRRTLNFVHIAPVYLMSTNNIYIYIYIYLSNIIN